MISRIWHGWVLPGNAEAYENLLKSEIFTGIKNKQMNGFKDIQLLRRKLGDEIEFVTIMRFTSIESIKEFAGDDYEVCVVPTEARKLLLRFDQKAQHYEIRIEND